MYRFKGCRIEHKAKKAFGQNFLKDEHILERIIESMPHSDREIAEIGPGLGDLTRKLLTLKDVVAFEVDTDLRDILERTFASDLEAGRLTLHFGNVLERWGNDPLLTAPYDLVANLPYYVATNIVLKALEDTHCHTIFVMVQKEVAEKFSATPGEKNFGSISILAQSRGNVKIAFDIPPESFDPPPKVVSSMLLIQKESSFLEKEFERFLRFAFAQPRRKLMKNLSSAYSRNQLESAFSTVGLTESQRPHETTVQSYHRLYKNLNKGGTNERDQQ